MSARRSLRAELMHAPHDFLLRPPALGRVLGIAYHVLAREEKLFGQHRWRHYKIYEIVGREQRHVGKKGCRARAAVPKGVRQARDTSVAPHHVLLDRQRCIGARTVPRTAPRVHPGSVAALVPGVQWVRRGRALPREGPNRGKRGAHGREADVMLDIHIVPVVARHCGEFVTAYGPQLAGVKMGLAAPNSCLRPSSRLFGWPVLRPPERPPCPNACVHRGRLFSLF
jgi:hypothetical protein